MKINLRFIVFATLAPTLVRQFFRQRWVFVFWSEIGSTIFQTLCPDLIPDQIFVRPLRDYNNFQTLYLGWHLALMCDQKNDQRWPLKMQKVWSEKFEKLWEIFLLEINEIEHCSNIADTLTKNQLIWFQSGQNFHWVDLWREEAHLCLPSWDGFVLLLGRMFQSI